MHDECVENWLVEDREMVSDHRGIRFDVRLGEGARVAEERGNVVKKFNLRKGDWKRYEEHVGKLVQNMPRRLRRGNVHEKTEALVAILKMQWKHHAPAGNPTTGNR
jgi:hypothetical protein